MEMVIAEIIRRHPSCRIMLFGGGQKEMDVLNDWCNRYKNCLNVSALLGSLQQEMIVMSQLDTMVSMDSANMHLASICGTRVVSVWGATYPYAGFMGWNQSVDDAVQLDMPCRPCSIYGNRPCLRGDYACLNNIDPVAIADRVELGIRN